MQIFKGESTVSFHYMVMLQSKLPQKEAVILPGMMPRTDFHILCPPGLLNTVLYFLYFVQICSELENVAINFVCISHGAVLKSLCPEKNPDRAVRFLGCHQDAIQFLYSFSLNTLHHRRECAMTERNFYNKEQSRHIL